MGVSYRGGSGVCPTGKWHVFPSLSLRAQTRDLDENLDATTEMENRVKRRFLLDVVIEKVRVSQGVRALINVGMIETLLVGRILYGFKVLHGNVENIRTIESGKVLFWLLPSEDKCCRLGKMVRSGSDSPTRILWRLRSKRVHRSDVREGEMLLV